jgi:hypothetical protein
MDIGRGRTGAGALNNLSTPYINTTFFTLILFSYPEDEGSRFLRNIGKFLPGKTMSHSRR